MQYTYTSTCEKVAKFEITAVAGTSDYNVVPVAVYPADQACTGVNGTDVATLKVTDVGDGPRRFLINGSNQTIIANAPRDIANGRYPVGCRISARTVIEASPWSRPAINVG